MTRYVESLENSKHAETAFTLISDNEHNVTTTNKDCMSIVDTNVKLSPIVALTHEKNRGLKRGITGTRMTRRRPWSWMK
jgi:hypothetical protein